MKLKMITLFTCVKSFATSVTSKMVALFLVLTLLRE